MNDVKIPHGDVQALHDAAKTVLKTIGNGNGWGFPAMVARTTSTWLEGSEATEAGWQRGVADERARCLKVLEDLRDSSQHSGAEWIAYRFAITALSNASSPVASSPVGGEQHG